MTTRIPILLVMLICCTSVFSQEAEKSKRIKLFLDCITVLCDGTYIRTEINLVDFVFDRLAADVHVLTTAQPLGNGGRKYQMIFYGQNAFSKLLDTLRFDMPPMATEFEIREKLLTYLKLGLVPYITKSDMVQHITLTMKRDEADHNRVVEEKDKWNYWVFRLGANGSIRADQNYVSTNLNTNFSINRTTEKTRVEFRFSAGKDKTVYKFENDEGEEEQFTVDNTKYNIRHLMVWSLTDHWSYGYYLFHRNNTFSNYQNSVRFLPGMEYNIFPYKDVNTKYFAIGYGLEVTHNNYYQETIYNQMKETLLGHSARVVSSVNQKWGIIRGSLYYNNFFHDWKLYSLELNLDVDVRLTGNLNLWFYMFGGLTRNQIFILKGTTKPEEVLTRRRQLASGYDFGMWFGINYRFGSMLNNFVNPRFSD
jgi:hypothetical protein